MSECKFRAAEGGMSMSNAIFSILIGIYVVGVYCLGFYMGRRSK